MPYSAAFRTVTVIVITLDKTDQKRLPKALRARTFLDYSESVERQGWEKRLIKHLKAPNYKKNLKQALANCCLTWAM